MAGPYVYLVGLLIFGVILGTIGLVAAERERRSRQIADGPSGQLRPPHSQPPATAR